jgi:hypothetical protein
MVASSPAFPAGFQELVVAFPVQLDLHGFGRRSTGGQHGEQRQSPEYSQDVTHFYLH